MAPDDDLGTSGSAGARNSVRTLFLSDVHLGTKGCQAEFLLDFLRTVETDTIVLVGDIIDGWRLKAGWYWPQLHNDVIQKLLRRVRKGARILYVPGNHDEFLRDYEGSHFGGVEIHRELVHRTADGKRYLVLHGDKFDVVVRNVKWLAHLGDWAYDWAIAVNVVVGWTRRRLGLPYWSFSGWSKSKVKSAVSFIGAFEDAVVSEARKHGVDGVICGHIHHPAVRDIEGVRYVNTGDWVESCTAVVEHHDGRLELIRWASPATAARLPPSPAAIRVAA
ncbi:MAG: UDP-2,3-diacylglucosamine diphosphatase [Alsobacter sp.]